MKEAHGTCEVQAGEKTAVKAGETPVVTIVQAESTASGSPPTSTW
jgi:hypothetical protein